MNLFMRSKKNFSAGRAAERSTIRANAPCYYDLSNGISVPDSAFTAVLGRPIPPRERQKGEAHTLNVTLSEVRHTPLGWLLGFIGRKIALKATGTNEVGTQIVDHILYTTPLRLMSMESGFSPRQIEGIVMLLNHKPFGGLRALFEKK